MFLPCRGLAPLGRIGSASLEAMLRLDILRLDDADDADAHHPDSTMTWPASPVAVVTGAASGIGRAFVHGLVRRGFSCVAADRDVVGLANLAQECVDRLRLETMITDVANAGEIQRLSARSFERFGRVDLLVNCAGVLTAGLSWEIASAEWRRVIDVNLFSVVEAVRSFVPRLIAQGSGYILNVASMAAVTSGAMVGPYSVSKHGVLALSECLAREFASLGLPIGVSVVCPGAVNTNIAHQDDGQGGLANETMDFLKTVIANGMSPDELVEIVLDRVDTGEFCIFPHSEVRDSAQRRVDQLLAGRLQF